MEMWLEGLSTVFQGNNLIMLLVGTVYGIIVGALPGIGPMFACSLVLPLTFGMRVESAIILLSAVYASSTFGGSFASILINTPGGVGSVATCWDGYPLAKKGRAGFAIGVVSTASLLGGVLGWLCLVFLAPVFTSIALNMRSAEYFMLGVFALCLVSMAAEGQTIKGLILGSLGLLVSMIGRDPMTAAVRQTYGIMYLEDGIPLAAIALGMFAISEAIDLSANMYKQPEVINAEDSVKTGVMFGFTKPLITIRSGLLGVFMGIVPALGIQAASISAYFIEKKYSKEPETFGKGNPVGLLAPEAANNACVVSSLIPAFTLGIPGSPVAALFIAALIIHGVQPGVQFFSRGAFTHTIFMGILFSQFAFFVIGLLSAKLFAKIVRIPVSLLIPTITILSAAGAYAIRNTVLDIFFAIIFGFFGYILKKYNWPVACFVFGNVLGVILESNFHRVLFASGGSYAPFYTRPGSLGILIATILFMGWPLIKKVFLKIRKT